MFFSLPIIKKTSGVFTYFQEVFHNFLSRTPIRTFEAEKLQKNKHIQPQLKFRRSNKKKTCRL